MHNSPEFGTGFCLLILETRRLTALRDPFGDFRVPSVDFFLNSAGSYLEGNTVRRKQDGSSLGFCKVAAQKIGVTWHINLKHTLKGPLEGKWTQQSQELKSLLWALPGLDRFWKQMSNLCFLVLLSVGP